MVRRMLILGFAAASLMSPGVPVVARAQSSASTPDLTGFWRLDPAHSDMVMRPDGAGGEGGGGGGASGGAGEHHGGWGGGHGGMGGGGHHGGGGMGGGGWGGAHGGGSGEPSGGQGQSAARPVRMPELMHVTETETIVSFEDSTGAVLQEITTLGAAKDTLLHSPGAAVFPGTWKDATLTVEHQSPRGKMVQTWQLGPGGNTLILQTHLESADHSMPARDFKRVYKKVTDS
jgi:hypothetical protein